jgi:hypothetical protein
MSTQVIARFIPSGATVTRLCVTASLRLRAVSR